MSSKFVRFFLVGAIGFSVDAGVLTTLLKANMPAHWARTISFLLAVTTTWAINRVWTFKVKQPVKKHHEYAGYMAIQGSGAAINMGIFMGLISYQPKLIEIPLVPLGAGAAVSMLWNYALTKNWFSRIQK